MSSDYFVENNDKTDMTKNSSYVQAYIFPSHIEGKGIAVARHFKTKAEIQKEIEELKNLPVSQEEYDRRLAKLMEELEKRKQVHSTKTTRSKVRTDNMQSLRRSQKNLTLYCYGNFDMEWVSMATLTYAHKVYDMKQTMKDFEPFRRKFKKKFPNAVWLAVFEFCEDGSTHVHFVYRNAKGANHELLTKMWRSGYGLCN